MARRVLIATPTTLLAVLRAVAYGWQQERVAESAQAISELGRELHGRLVRLSSLLAKLGRQLNSAVGAYNEAVGSYEARVLPGARRFAEHGVGSAAGELAALEQVTVNARTVSVDEQPAASDEHGDSQPLAQDELPTVHPHPLAQDELPTVHPLRAAR
jgi:DNA recombination protein RmuC